MKKTLIVVLLIGTVAMAGTPRLKSMVDVYSDPGKATSLELNLATMDLMAMAARLAAESGDRDNMKKALVHLRDTASLMLKDMERPALSKAP